MHKLNIRGFSLFEVKNTLEVSADKTLPYNIKQILVVIILTRGTNAYRHKINETFYQQFSVKGGKIFILSDQSYGLPPSNLQPKTPRATAFC